MALLYPANVLAGLLFSPAIGLLVLTAVNVGVAVFATFWGLRRCFALGRSAAALGATVYAFGGVFATRIEAGHLTVVTALAWTPMAVLTIHRGVAELNACDSGTRKFDFSNWRAELRACMTNRFLLLAAITNGLVVLAGAPQYVVYLFWAEVAAAVFSAPLRRLPGAILVLMAAWILAALLTCAQWLPTLAYLPFTARTGHQGAMLGSSLDRLLLVMETLLPFPLGDDLRRPHLFMKNVWEVYAYPGAIALVLAVSCLLPLLFSHTAWRCPRRRVVFGVLALGIYLSCGRQLPGLNSFREPMKARGLISLGIAFGAALEFEALGASLAESARLSRKTVLGFFGKSPARLLLVSATLCVACLIANCAIAGQRASTGQTIVQWAMLSIATSRKLLEPYILNPALAAEGLEQAILRLLVAALVVTMIVAVMVFTRRSSLIILLLFCTLEPVGYHFYCFVSRNPVSSVQFPASYLATIHKEYLATSREHSPPWRTSLNPDMANLSHMNDEVWETGGYDPLMPEGANNRQVLLGMANVASRDELGWVASNAFGRRLDFTNKSPLATEDDLTSAAAKTRKTLSVVSISRNVEAGSGSPMWYGPDVKGRSWALPPEFAQTEAGADDLPLEFVARIQSLATSGSVVFGEGGSAPVAGLEAGESVRYDSAQSPNSFALQCNLVRPALMILKTTWLPGWRVSVNSGPKGKTLFVNSWEIGAIVPKGSSNVNFQYRPANFWPAAGVSLLACGFIITLLWRSRRTARPAIAN